MPSSWFGLSKQNQLEALNVASDHSGRPSHLLEKDIWVVWVLSAIYGSELAEKVTFKGGTSLSKVYGVIDRFSEDIDLTYDIRELIEGVADVPEVRPDSRNHANRIRSAVTKQLPERIKAVIVPVIETASSQLKAGISWEIAGNDSEKLIINYPTLTSGTGYAAPTVQLEFGARSTGIPHAFHDVMCDAAPHVPDVTFPVATPLVMGIARTFWEKATLAHVFCAKGNGPGNRYSRHWYDLAAIARSAEFDAIMADFQVAEQVAAHKGWFFREKGPEGNIDYQRAVNGAIALVPTGDARAALEADYTAMCSDRLVPEDAPTFEEIVTACEEIQGRINAR